MCHLSACRGLVHQCAPRAHLHRCILVSTQCLCAHPQITDFGLARRISGEAAMDKGPPKDPQSLLTPCGTAAWVAPEMLHESGQYDEKVDLVRSRAGVHTSAFITRCHTATTHTSTTRATPPCLVCRTLVCLTHTCLYIFCCPSTCVCVCLCQYSFGIVMWELMAMREPFGGAREAEVRHIQIHCLKTRQERIQYCNPLIVSVLFLPWMGKRR